MSDELWLPNSARDTVEKSTTHERRVMPTERKKGGGSHFDDELETEKASVNEVAKMRHELIVHINNRPDHDIYVGSAEERGKMRNVFNHWKQAGLINHNPNIRIDYGVADGAIRVGEH